MSAPTLPMPAVAEVLEAAADLIDEVGWSPAFCAVLAIRQAASRRPGAPVLVQAAYERLSRHLDLKVRRRTWGEAIIEWNDRIANDQFTVTTALRASAKEHVPT